MADKNISQKENKNIGENTNWDSPKIDPNAGSTVRKPSTFLNPENDPKKQ